MQRMPQVLDCGSFIFETNVAAQLAALAFFEYDFLIKSRRSRENNL
jgi:hypothetical protein